MKSLKNDWDEVRCNPFLMPFAAMIHQDEGVSAIEYTQKNFENCLNDTMRPLAKVSLKPLNNIAGILSEDILSAGKEIADLNFEMDQQEDEAAETDHSFTDQMLTRLNSSYILLHSFKEIVYKMNGISFLITYQMKAAMYLIMSIINKIIKTIKKIPGGGLLIKRQRS
jgi:hypothetical protein